MVVSGSGPCRDWPWLRVLPACLSDATAVDCGALPPWPTELARHPSRAAIMGRIFEVRKHAMFARWNRMAKQFSVVAEDLKITVKAGGKEQGSNPDTPGA